MPRSLGDLEQQRSAIVQQLTDLGDFRPGSITTTSGRCGKPNCRCHRPRPTTARTDGSTHVQSRRQDCQRVPSHFCGVRQGGARGGGVPALAATQSTFR